MILIVDNYVRDGGCTANQMAEALRARRQPMALFGNDKLSIAQIEEIEPDLIILSPGVCAPAEAGISVELVGRFKERIPIVGIGAGFHCVAAAFGAKIVRAKKVMHSREDSVTHDGAGLFLDLPSPIGAVRSHSLAIERSTLPDELMVTATSTDDEIMGIRHREFAIEALQFRPQVALQGENTGHVQTYTFDSLLWRMKNFGTRSGNRIETVDVTSELLTLLRKDEDNLYKITPEKFELFIADRLDAAGFAVMRVGATYSRDGGIDIIALPRFPSPCPFLLAVQVKHHSRADRKTGSPEVREFAGAIGHYEIQGGALITNTSFTADAEEWVARNRSKMLRLRDLRDVRRWLRDDFVDPAERRDLPSKIVLGRGIEVQISDFFRVPGMKHGGDSGHQMTDLDLRTRKNWGDL
jgi:anthranilate synthase component 2